MEKNTLAVSARILRQISNVRMMTMSAVQMSTALCTFSLSLSVAFVSPLSTKTSVISRATSRKSRMMMKVCTYTLYTKSLHFVRMEKDSSSLEPAARASGSPPPPPPSPSSSARAFTLTVDPRFPASPSASPPALASPEKIGLSLGGLLVVASEPTGPSSASIVAVAFASPSCCKLLNRGLLCCVVRFCTVTEVSVLTTSSCVRGFSSFRIEFSQLISVKAMACSSSSLLPLLSIELHAPRPRQPVLVKRTKHTRSGYVPPVCDPLDPQFAILWEKLRTPRSDETKVRAASPSRLSWMTPPPFALRDASSAVARQHRCPGLGWPAKIFQPWGLKEML